MSIGASAALLASGVVVTPSIARADGEPTAPAGYHWETPETTGLVGGDMLISVGEQGPVREYDAQGNRVGSILSGIYPGVIGIEPSGILDVLDKLSGTIKRIKTDGRLISTIDVPYQNAYDDVISIQFSEDGTGYVEASNHTFRLRSGVLTEIPFIDTMGQPIAVAPDGCVIFFAGSQEVSPGLAAIHRWDVCASTPSELDPWMFPQRDASTDDRHFYGAGFYRGIATDPSGESVVVSDGKTLYGVDGQGYRSLASTGPSWQFFHDLTISSDDGSIWAEQVPNEVRGLLDYCPNGTVPGSTSGNLAVHFAADGTYLAAVATEITCLSTISSAIAIVPGLVGGHNPQPRLVKDTVAGGCTDADGNPVTDDGLSGATGGSDTCIRAQAKADFTVGIGTNKTTVTPGDYAAVTATANKTITGTEDFLSIYSLNDGRLVRRCAAGTTCTAQIPWSPDDQDFVAYVGPSTSRPYDDFLALSAPLRVGPAWTVAAQVTPNGKEFIVQLNAPLAGSGLHIEMFTARDHQLVQDCGVGSECKLTKTFADASEQYVAFLMPASDVYPTPSDWVLRSPVVNLPNLANDGTGNPGQNCAGQPCMEDPVNPADGSLHAHEIDIQVGGRGIPLNATRSYDSGHVTKPSRLGYGWSDSNLLTLRRMDASDVVVLQENGTPIAFTQNTDGTFTADAKSRATLVATTNGYVFTRRHNELYTFDLHGLLISAADLLGHATTYAYDDDGRLASVTDPEGRTLSYSYNSMGYVGHIAGPGALSADYNYDDAGDLATVTKANGDTWRYSYDSHHELTQSVTPAGVTTTNSYDELGRVVGQQTANGHTTFAYGSDGGVDVTHAAGDAVHLSYTNGQLAAMTRAAGTPQAATTSYTYDATTLGVASVTDPVGRTTRLAYDADGNLVRLTDAGGHVATYTYDSLGDRTSQTDPSGATTQWHYNSSAQLTGVTAADGAAVTYAYDAAGDLVRVTDARGASSQLSYDVNGYLDKVVNPLGATSFIAHDAVGRPVSSTDALGHVTLYSSDLIGRVTGITDPAGGTTHLTYDGDGDVTATTDPTGLTTTTAYNGAGDVAKVTDASGAFVSYSYDASGRPTAVTDSAGNAVKTQYDAPGLVSATTDALGHRTTYAYDASGLLTATTSPNGAVTRYTYDTVGRMATVTDPLGHVTSFQRDGNGRAVKVTDAAGGVTQSTLDAAGRVTAVQQANGAIRRFTYDAAGALLSDTDPAGNVRRYTYDAAGRQLTAADPLGRATTTSYDALGRVTTVTDPLNRSSSFSYDAASRLTRISYSDSTPAVGYSYDAAGRRLRMTDGTGSTAYAYDSVGRLTTVASPGGSSVGYGYDPLGRVARVTYPDGRVVSRSYDAAGNLAGVTDAGKTTGFSYDLDGNLTAVAHPNGVVDSMAYDLGGQLTSTAIGSATQPSSVASLTYGMDVRSLAASVTSTGLNMPTETYAHDALSRLTAVTGVSTGSYTYDSAGNLTGRADGAKLAYDAAGQLKSLMSASGVVNSFTFDAAGEWTRVDGPGTTAAACAVCVLDTSATGSLAASGTSRVTTPGVISVASASATAVQASGSALVSGSTVYLGGASQTSGTAKITPVPLSGTTSDPFAGLSSPAGGPARGAAVVTGSQVVTLQPGTYTSMNLAGASRVMLAAGTYVVTGPVTIGGSASVTGTGVSLYLTCAAQPAPCASSAAGKLSVSGTARLDLTGGAFGPGRGVALRTDSSSAAGTVDVSGSGHVGVVGSAAFGTAVVTVSGNADVTVDGGLLVTGRLAVTGSSRVAVGAGAAGLASTSYRYNAAGELVGVDGPAVNASYSYNGDGLRVSAATNGVTQKFSWDVLGGVPALLSDGSHDFVYGDHVTPIHQWDTPSNVVTYLHADRIGSVRALTNAAGVKVGTASYEAFGRPLSSSGVSSPFGFAGSYTDAGTGLLYLRARFLDPGTGQFLTVDPLVSLTGSPYLYADGDPTDRTDPSGLSSFFGGVGQGAKQFVVGNLTAIGGLMVDPLGSVRDAERGLEDVYVANGEGIMGRAALFDQLNPVSMALNTFWGISGSTSAQGAGCAAAFGVLQIASLFAPGAGGGVVRSIAGAIEKGVSKLGRAGELIGDVSVADRFAEAVDGLICNCFPAGTLVATSSGDKAIEDIKVGDEVWAKNLTTGKRELRKVVGLFHKHTDELMDITVAGTVVTVTSKHPFYVPGRGWVMSGILKVGDQLLQRDGTIVSITEIRHYAADTTVYNFEVEGDHNYYVSQAQLLVHNCASLDLTALVANARRAIGGIKNQKTFAETAWGGGGPNAAGAARALIGARTAAELEAQGITVAQATAWRDVYEAVVSAGRGTAREGTAQARLDLMNDIITTLGG